MHFQQVALTVMAFSSARGGTVEPATTTPAHHQEVTIIPPLGLSRITVEEDNAVPGVWGVRLVQGGHSSRRSLFPPLYFPPVTTQDSLLTALHHAWDIHIQSQHRPAPFITRFLEPPRTPPKSASPPSRQRGVSPQTFPDLA